MRADLRSDGIAVKIVRYYKSLCSALVEEEEVAGACCGLRTDAEQVASEQSLLRP